MFESQLLPFPADCLFPSLAPSSARLAVSVTCGGHVRGREPAFCPPAVPLQSLRSSVSLSHSTETALSSRRALQMGLNPNETLPSTTQPPRRGHLLGQSPYSASLVPDSPRPQPP